MDELIISDTGFPGTNETWRKVQDAYRKPLLGLGKFVATNAIIEGVVDNGTNITDGTIVYNGEILPFIGGPTQPQFEIVEVTENRFYDNGSTNSLPAYKVRYARPVGSGGIQLTSLKALPRVEDFIKNTVKGTLRLYRDTNGDLQTISTGGIYNVSVSNYVGSNTVISIEHDPIESENYQPVISDYTVATDHAIVMSNINNVGVSSIIGCNLNVIGVSVNDIQSLALNIDINS